MDWYLSVKKKKEKKAGSRPILRIFKTKELSLKHVCSFLFYLQVMFFEVERSKSD